MRASRRDVLGGGLAVLLGALGLGGCAAAETTRVITDPSAGHEPLAPSTGRGSAGSLVSRPPWQRVRA